MITAYQGKKLKKKKEKECNVKYQTCEFETSALHERCLTLFSLKINNLLSMDSILNYPCNSRFLKIAKNWFNT